MDPDEGLSDDLVGTTLQNTYLLGRVIGEGGMGRVFEAQHTRIAGKRFAVKVIRAEMAGSPEVRARFQREADAAASIAHPNVVAVHDFGYAEDGRPYLVCEYLEGKSLGDVIKERGQLPFDLAVHIARKVAQGLAAAHQEGVIHRDLKPDNVHLIGPADVPEVKVLDFGLSRFIEASGNSVTRTGIAMGTPSFMAPEQARGERMDHRVDIYGVGVILYNALTGRPPFEEESVHQTMLAVMNSEPTRPRAVNPAIPEELELVIQRAMASNPDERFQTMEELDAALAHFDVRAREEPPSVNRAPRRQLLSRAGSVSDDVEVGAARPQVVFLAALAVLAGAFALATTVSGFPDLVGRKPLSPSEFWLTLAVVVGTLLTPGVLLARWFWRKFWNNSVKMVELVPRLRGPIVGAIATYGALALASRALDAVIARSTHGDAPGYSTWAGFAPVWAVIAVLAALSIMLRRRFLDSTNGGAGKLLAGPVLTSLTVVVALGLLHVGNRARSRDAGAVPPEREPLVLVASPSAKPVASAPHVVPSVPEHPPAAGVVPAARASSEEVRAASAQGSAGLDALAKRFPNDPAVLEPLVLSLGGEPEGLARAMTELDRLFQIAPDKANDKNLGSLVVKAALSPGEASTRALDLMATRMGSLGPDMLYDLMLTSVPLRQATRERLDDPKVQKLFSPGLSIAFDLRTSKTCEERLPLLPRAASDGDARSVAFLISISTGAKKGCGPRKNKPCQPACPAEAAAMKDTALKLQARLAQKR